MLTSWFTEVVRKRKNSVCLPMSPVPNQITRQNINIDSSMGQINVSHRMNGLDNMTLFTPAEGSLLGYMPICVLQGSVFNCDKQKRKLQRERETYHLRSSG